MLLHFYTGCIFLVFYVQKLVAKVCQVQSLMIYPLCCNIWWWFTVWMPQTIWIWICIFLYARWLKYFFIVEMQCVDCQVRLRIFPFLIFCYYAWCSSVIERILALQELIQHRLVWEMFYDNYDSLWGFSFEVWNIEGPFLWYAKICGLVTIMVSIWVLRAVPQRTLWDHNWIMAYKFYEESLYLY